MSSNAFSFKIGQEVWGVRERNRNDWTGPTLFKITEIDGAYIVGRLAAEGGGFCSWECTFEPKLVFAKKEDAQKVFDKIEKLVNVKARADAKIRAITRLY